MNCNKRGHYASNCPEPSTRTGISNLQYGHILAQVEGVTGLIPPDWVLLDTCSTDNVIRDSMLLTSMRTCPVEEELKIHTNGGKMTYKDVENFKYLPLQSYYNPRLIANILSLKEVDDIEGVHIEMNNKQQPGIAVIMNRKKLVFHTSLNGLFYCTIDELKRFHSETDHNQPRISLLSTTVETMLNRAKERAARERELQKVLMWPSSTSLKQILCKGGVSGTTDLTAKDVDRADILFEKASETVKGKMTATSMTKNIYPSKQYRRIYHCWLNVLSCM